MEKDTISTRELTYRDEALGDLIFDEANITVERTEDRVIIKVYAPKEQNWLQLADQVWCATSMMARWAWDKKREGKELFAEMPALERDKGLEDDRFEQLGSDNDPYLYLYFHSDHNWVMYESDDTYLFLYEMEIKDSYALGINRQMEALRFWPKDDLGSLMSFMRSWYYRVNGYPEEKE